MRNAPVWRAMWNYAVAAAGGFFAGVIGIIIVKMFGWRWGGVWAMISTVPRQVRQKRRGFERTRRTEAMNDVDEDHDTNRLLDTGVGASIGGRLAGEGGMGESTLTRGQERRVQDWIQRRMAVRGDTLSPTVTFASAEEAKRARTSVQHVNEGDEFAPWGEKEEPELLPR